MSGNDEERERRILEITETLEAYSGIVPHHSIIAGYQKAIPDGGREVIP